jgi:DNA invertase Pin-like site-specific DNA recombinase
MNAMVTRSDLIRSKCEMLQNMLRLEYVAAVTSNFMAVTDLPPCDTSRPQSRLLSTLPAAVAEFEREIISERTEAVNAPWPMV